MPRERGDFDGPSDRRGGRYGGPRDRPGERDRDNDRYRRDDRRDNRDRERDRDRRYRSRSRDRRDGVRDWDRRDDRGRVGGGGGDRGDRGGRPRQDFGRDRDRDRVRERGRDEDGDRRRRDDDDTADRPARRREDGEYAARNREKDRRRSASPPQGITSPTPRRHEPRQTETLPTRSRGGDLPSKKDHQTMSFKVGRQESPNADGGRDEARDDTAMTDDGPGRGRRKERQEEEVEEDDDIEVEVDDDTAVMQAMMGFGGFGSTKGQKIAGNNVGGVRKEKKTEYRQYMNRQGGFNRPLSPGR